MTKRFLYNKTWAQDGVKADPDLDTTDPSYIADRYANVGWKAEKPPEQWQNFLSNITDEKFADNLISLGVPAWESHNLLKNGALSYSPDNSEIRIGVGGTGWDAAVSGTSSGYTSVINSLQNKYNTHTSATNPHNNTVDNIIGGTYLSKDVDAWFGSQTDNRTIVWHKLQTGAVHKETPAQVGTLPSTGGIFTGTVGFDTVRFGKDSLMSVTDAYYTGTVLRFVNSSAFFLDETGNVFTRIASKNYKWATEININDWYIKTNYLFTEPTPLVAMNTFYCLNDANSVGSWHLVSQNNVNPTFHSLGGVDIAACRLAWVMPKSTSARHTSKIVGRKADGSLVCRVVKHGMISTVNEFTTVLSDLGSSDIAYLIEYRLYVGDLTNQQISSIRFI